MPIPTLQQRFCHENYCNLSDTIENFILFDENEKDRVEP